MQYFLQVPCRICEGSLSGAGRTALQPILILVVRLVAIRITAFLTMRIGLASSPIPDLIFRITDKKQSGRGKNQAVRSANRTNLSISPAPAVNIAPETRPKNLALMYIVTTDQTDNIKPDPTPTNIVVTPSSLNTGVGSTQQFTDQVLPADLAPSFPVTWISTNTAAGIIDGNGLFRAVGPGSTDIIASVSSGLSVRVTVRVDILLTSISLAVIPDQIAGKIQLLNTGTMRSVIPGCFQRGNRINDNTRAMPRSERD